MEEPAIRQMTLADFLRWEDGTDTRYELIGAFPMAMAPPARPHGILSVRLGAAIDGALLSRRPCMTQAEAGIVRPDRDDTFMWPIWPNLQPYQRGSNWLKSRS